MKIGTITSKDFIEGKSLKIEVGIDLSLNRSLSELESSYWEFIEATEGEDSSGWSKSVQEDLSALEGYLMKMEVL